jgi:RNA polymerase sigma factor (sigma-70 family)
LASITTAISYPHGCIVSRSIPPYRTENTLPFTEDLLEIADDNAETNDHIKQLYTFINALDELNRALMILYLDDNSYREIGDILGISETNVATKISRIKQQLKKQFATI